MTIIFQGALKTKKKVCVCVYIWCCCKNYFKITALTNSFSSTESSLVEKKHFMTSCCMNIVPKSRVFSLCHVWRVTLAQNKAVPYSQYVKRYFRTPEQHFTKTIKSFFTSFFFLKYVKIHLVHHVALESDLKVFSLCQTLTPNNPQSQNSTEHVSVTSWPWSCFGPHNFKPHQVFRPQTLVAWSDLVILS